MEENKEVAEDATQDPVEETTQQEPVYNEDGDRKIDLTPPPKTPEENETTETPEATNDNVVEKYTRKLKHKKR